MRALLPVITTRRPDRRDRGYLAWVAVAGEVAHLTLETAPIDGSTHVLEIYVDGFDDPLVVIADPVGAPDNAGEFPLRLSPLDDEHGAALRRELFGAAHDPIDELGPPPESPRQDPLAPAMASSKRTTEPPVALSLEHVAAIARTTGGGGPSTASRRAPGALRGRGLADGRFMLEQLLGGGASGEVYRAVHTVLRRPVAVKVLHPSLQYSQDYCARFYAEALAASQLDHPNVLRILDYGQEPDGLLYIVMELLEGRNLQQILDEDGPLPLERLVTIASQACAGLGHAHDAGVIHRDIKPANVVVVKRKDDEGNESDLVKVCDFGIAHWVPEEMKRDITDDDDTLVRLPDATKVVGTPAYMAPEQIRNETVDERSDVYALGVLLYELGTGVLPFLSNRPMEILMMHVTERPKPPSRRKADFDPELERIVLKSLEKDPARRYPNVRALRSDLRQLSSDERNLGSGQYLRVTARAVPTASDFASRTADALAIVSTSEGSVRDLAVQSLGEALRAAVSNANLKLARDLLGFLEDRLADPGLRADERESLDRAMRVVRDPAPTRQLAGQLLSGKLERAEDALPILALSGPVGARSLLEARRAQPPSLEVRGRFVSYLKATGAAALPVILGALEPLAPLTTRSDEALAEDLLRAVPDVRSDLGGELTVRFVRADKPGLAVVALDATVNLWGPRAHALLLGVLDSTIDPVRIAAVLALQRLRTVDDWAIERLGRILLPNGTASLELRTLAAATLGFAPTESRARVAAFLTERLVPPQQGLARSLINKAFGPREDGHVVVALARSLIALDPAGGRHTVHQLIAGRPELRAELDLVLAGR
ncbi:MAG: Serine/threonine protein kinase PrkC, regulator of stationary phase [Labilithrix sp.]|nr:Serine/threonine protein kinase PrkC, regulator of stationary phase [Labilithrix sp.]